MESTKKPLRLSDITNRTLREWFGWQVAEDDERRHNINKLIVRANSTMKGLPWTPPKSK